MIIRTAKPDFFPGLPMAWVEARDRAETLDVGRLKGEEMTHHTRNHPGLPAVNPLEMPEEQCQTHQMQRAQLVFQST